MSSGDIDLSDRNDYNDPIVVETIREMFMAIQNNDAHLVLEILTRDIIDINTISPQFDYNWFLMAASFFIHSDIVELLLNYGAYVNIQGRHGLTALDYAYGNISLHHRRRRFLTPLQLAENNLVIVTLQEYGGQTREQYEADIDAAAAGRHLYMDSSDSEPSDPDIDILRNEAATTIQKRLRWRHGMNNSLNRRLGSLGKPNNDKERMRRFTDHTRRMTGEGDELAGYLYPQYFNSKSGDNITKQSNRKFVKRTKRRKKRRY